MRRQHMLSFQQNFRSISQQKYLSMQFLDKVNKLHYVHILKMAPYNKFKVLNSIYSQLPYQKLVRNKCCEILLNNDQVLRLCMPRLK